MPNRKGNEPVHVKEVVATGATPAGDSQAHSGTYMAGRQRLGEVITESAASFTD
jgi:hypothetical protein